MITSASTRRDSKNPPLNGPSLLVAGLRRDAAEVVGFEGVTKCSYQINGQGFLSVQTITGYPLLFCESQLFGGGIAVEPRNAMRTVAAAMALSLSLTLLTGCFSPSL